MPSLSCFSNHLSNIVASAQGSLIDTFPHFLAAHDKSRLSHQAVGALSNFLSQTFYNSVVLRFLNIGNVIVCIYGSNWPKSLSMKVRCCLLNFRNSAACIITVYAYCSANNACCNTAGSIGPTEFNWNNGINLCSTEFSKVFNGFSKHFFLRIIRIHVTEICHLRFNLRGMGCNRAHQEGASGSCFIRDIICIYPSYLSSFFNLAHQ